MDSSENTVLHLAMQLYFEGVLVAKDVIDILNVEPSKKPLNPLKPPRPEDVIPGQIDPEEFLKSRNTKETNLYNGLTGISGI